MCWSKGWLIFPSKSTVDAGFNSILCSIMEKVRTSLENLSGTIFRLRSWPLVSDSGIGKYEDLRETVRT
jgi:hypothetical protein